MGQKLYKVRHEIVPALPDDHLTLNEYDPEAIKNGGMVQGKYLEGHMNPELVRDMAELHRHLSYAGILAPGTAENVQLWFEWTPVEFLPLTTMGLRVRKEGKIRMFELLVRRDMVSWELVRELNEWSIPHYLGED